MSSDTQGAHLRLVTPPNNLEKVPLLNLESYRCHVTHLVTWHCHCAWKAVVPQLENIEQAEAQQMSTKWKPYKKRSAENSNRHYRSRAVLATALERLYFVHDSGALDAVAAWRDAEDE